MILFFAISVLSVITLLVPQLAMGQAVASGKYGVRLQSIGQDYYDAGLFQGAVLVAMDGEVIYRDAFGMANLEWEVPNTPETRFTIASLGKAFTAALILQLRDEGRLSVDDLMIKHLPDLPPSIGGRVTIHQLLGHTGGIPWPQDTWEPEQYARRYELHELISLIESQELAFEPGTEFRYCNSCYHLLAAIIERITGNPFEHELRARILDPFDLSNTGIAYAEPLIEMRASGYERLEDGSLINAQLQDQSYALGAGGMYSTVDDLYRWHQALEGNALLSVESKALMFKPGLKSSGYGWAMGKYKKSGVEGLRTLAVGYGGTPGFASGMARLLDDGYFIVFLGNVRQVPQNQLMNDLWNTILGLDVEPLAR